MRSVACGKQRAPGGEREGKRGRGHGWGRGGRGRQVGCGPARLVATWPRLTPLIIVLPTAAQPSPPRYQQRGAAAAIRSAAVYHSANCREQCAAEGVFRHSLALALLSRVMSIHLPSTGMQARELRPSACSLL